MTGQREKRRRRRWSEEEKRTLVQRWKASGLSARDFAIQEGLSASNLSNWSSPRRSSAAREGTRSNKPVRTVTFAPVEVAKTPSQADDAGSRVQLELVVGSARVLVFEGADARMVSELVLAVAGRA